MPRPPRVVPLRQPPPGVGDWWQRLARDDRGRIIADFNNVMVALRGEEQLQFAFAFDEMMNRSIVTREWPRAPHANPAPKPIPRQIEDNDISGLQDWLQGCGIRRVGREVVGQAVEHLARERPQHPVRDYLENLKWDGVTRLHTWLFSYLGAEANSDTEIEYVRAIGRMFLVSMVARIFEPGCQCDYMLVLEGEQGRLKSSVCRALAGEWLSEHLPENIASKDASQHLAGKWLHEVSDLAAFSKAQVETLKAFITRREEKYRPPYGRHEVAEKRQCVFVGTTNQDLYIKDSTGGRRFWPVKCTGLIDVEGVRENRDNLFAEAVVAYRDGEHWWPDPQFEETYFKPQQERRQEQDPWLAEIEKGIENNPELSEFTVSQLAKTVLGFDGSSRIDSGVARRIVSCLKELGYAQHRTKTARVYRKPEPDDDDG